MTNYKVLRPVAPADPDARPGFVEVLDLIPSEGYVTSDLFKHLGKNRAGKGLAMTAGKQKHPASFGNGRIILTTPEGKPGRLHSLAGKTVRYELPPVEEWKTTGNMATEFHSIRPRLCHEIFDILHHAFGDSPGIRPSTRIVDFEVLGHSIARHAGHGEEKFDEALLMLMDVPSKTTYQLPKFWLKESAPENIETMLVTPDTSHVERSPLKESASWNILDMSVTPDTSHVERSPLKDPLKNILDMSVTPDTSHVERSPLKESAPENRDHDQYLAALDAFLAVSQQHAPVP